MDLSWWRDLVVVIWGLITAAALICACILAFLLYKKLVSLVEHVNIVVGKVGDVVDFTKEDIITPVMQFASTVQGIVQVITLIAEVLRSRRGKINRHPEAGLKGKRNKTVPQSN